MSEQSDIKLGISPKLQNVKYFSSICRNLEIYNLYLIKYDKLKLIVININAMNAFVKVWKENKKNLIVCFGALPSGLQDSAS